MDISTAALLSTYENSYTRWMNSVIYFIYVDKAWNTAKLMNQSPKILHTLNINC